jgi:hypothetical protein
MMGGLSTIRDSLVGAWQVMLGRVEGLNRLDFSLEGFWRSFAAVILLVPFVLLMLLSERPLAEEAGVAAEPLTSGRLALEFIALLTDWFAFPLLFAVIAPPFGLGSRYVPFIVTRNWASVIVGAMIGLIQVLIIIGGIPTPVASFVMLAAFAVSLRFSYVVVRITLAVSMGMALPIVVLDLLLSLTIWSAFDRLI